MLGYVVSDLHVFTKRTEIDIYKPYIDRAASFADNFVFNGDIFDFKWSTFSDHQDTLNAAGLWLESFISKYPTCKFYYIMGNHDNCPKWVEVLDQLKSMWDNFDWDPSYFKLGTSFFHHGDLFLEKKPLSREYESVKVIKSENQNKLYNLLIRSRVHKAIRYIYTKKGCCKLLSKALEENKIERIENFYFGHTHCPFSGYHYNGVTFHNTGSAVKGMKFNMLAFNY